MKQEFKQREIYDTEISTTWDLWNMKLNNVRSMTQEFKQREIYDTGI